MRHPCGRPGQSGAPGSSPSGRSPSFTGAGGQRPSWTGSMDMIDREPSRAASQGSCASPRRVAKAARPGSGRVLAAAHGHSGGGRKRSTGASDDDDGRRRAERFLRRPRASAAPTRWRASASGHARLIDPGPIRSGHAAVADAWRLEGPLGPGLAGSRSSVARSRRLAALGAPVHREPARGAWRRSGDRADRRARSGWPGRRRRDHHPPATRVRHARGAARSGSPSQPRTSRRGSRSGPSWAPAGGRRRVVPPLRPQARPHR